MPSWTLHTCLVRGGPGFNAHWDLANFLLCQFPQPCPLVLSEIALGKEINKPGVCCLDSAIMHTQILKRPFLQKVSLSVNLVTVTAVTAVITSQPFVPSPSSFLLTHTQTDTTHTSHHYANRQHDLPCRGQWKSFWLSYGHFCHERLVSFSFLSSLFIFLFPFFHVPVPLEQIFQFKTTLVPSAFLCGDFRMVPVLFDL